MALINRFAILAAIALALGCAAPANALPPISGASTAGDNNAQLVNVGWRHRRRHHRRRHHRHRHQHADYDYVDAPYTYVSPRRSRVVVDAPYASVYRSRRGVRVRAPYANVYVPW